MCPICNYPQKLERHDICPNCGFQPGFDDTTLPLKVLKHLYKIDKNYFWNTGKQQ